MAVVPLAAQGAAAEPIPGIPRTKYTIKVTSVHNGAVNRNKMLASCSAGIGGTCSISRSFSVQRTIQVNLGVSRDFVAGQIGFSKSTTATVTAQCNSRPFTKSGQVYRAYPLGVKKRYNIIRTISIDGKVIKTTTSSGEAFNPTGVSCTLS
ncbi:hypothetical protein ACIBEJ_24790 [Nonomuraea sp. NPDC050790]|uniref:hypothetical protein n=1 Tax=Nonomuraea sp. NPDC050790 TaxID=3364371 RepID=UPI0037B7679D